MRRLMRLIGVELRRATDTRSARWAFTIAILLAAVMCALGPGGTAVDFSRFIGASAIVIPPLIAVLTVMTFTSDWTSRAALTTFAVVPRRSRVLVARHVAALLLGVMSVLGIHAVGAVVFLMVRPVGAGTVAGPRTVGQFFEILGTTTAAALTSMAVAGLVLRTALAMLIAAGGPIAIVFGLAAWPGVLSWINPYAFAGWLNAPTLSWVGGAESPGIAPAFTSFVLWTAAPLVLAWIRQLRAEPR